VLGWYCGIIDIRVLQCFVRWRHCRMFRPRDTDCFPSLWLDKNFAHKSVFCVTYFQTCWMLSVLRRTGGWWFYIRLKEHWCSAIYVKAFLSDIELRRVVPLITSSNIEVFDQLYRGVPTAFSRWSTGSIKAFRQWRRVISRSSISFIEVFRQLYRGISPVVPRCSTSCIEVFADTGFFHHISNRSISYRCVPLTQGYSNGCIPVFC